MSNEVATFSAGHVLTDEQIELVKRTIMPEGSTDDELALFVQTAQRRGLDPFARQIYATKRRQKVRQGDGWVWVPRFQIEATIDGFRSIAERTDDYDGQEGPYWCSTDGEWTDVWLDPNHPPYAAKVVVYRKSASKSWTGVALWNEYAQVDNNGQPTTMWRKMASGQLAKCAEALALRKAFTQLSGLYTNDEMAQAGLAVDTATGEILEGEVVKPSAGDDTQHQAASGSEGGPEAAGSGSATAPAEGAPKRKRRTKAEMEEDARAKAAAQAEAAAEGNPPPDLDTGAKSEPEVEGEPQFSMGEPEPDGERPGIERLRAGLALLAKSEVKDVPELWELGAVLSHATKSFHHQIDRLEDLTDGEADRIWDAMKSYVEVEEAKGDGKDQHLPS